MTDTQQRTAVQQFANNWQGKRYEKDELQPFRLSFLNHVFEIKNPEKYIHFEDKVHLDLTSFIYHQFTGRFITTSKNFSFM